MQKHRTKYELSREFHWFNRGNLIEEDGPFKTILAAKKHAVSTYIHIQHGLAFDIVILNGLNDIVASGHIKKGKWIDGEYVAKKGEPGYVTFGFAEREKHATA